MDKNDSNMETDIEKLTEIVGEMAREAFRAEWNKMSITNKDVDTKVNEAYRRGCEDTGFLLGSDDFERKPFNAETYTPEKVVQTRDGRPVGILCTDANMGDGKSVVAIIKAANEDGTDMIEYYYSDGRVYNNSNESALDLVFVTRKKEGYVNVYVTSGGTYELGSENIYNTHREAFNNRKTISTYVCTTKIKWFDPQDNLKK